jgi:hypothetical protein
MDKFIKNYDLYLDFASRKISRSRQKANRQETKIRIGITTDQNYFNINHSVLNKAQRSQNELQHFSSLKHFKILHSKSKLDF